MRTLLPPLALAIALLALSGCGASKSSTSSTGSTATAGTTTASGQTNSNVAHANTGPALSTAELAIRANAICKRSNARIARTPGTVEKASDYARVGLPRAAIYRATLAELEKLTPPQSLAEAWQQMIAARSALAHTLATLGADAKIGDIKDMRVLVNSSGSISPQIAASATKAGVTECAKID
ncbi:MAG TPA: hypothetical protein VIJ39_10345 [Solirubrobacteraceae bacterium]